MAQNTYHNLVKMHLAVILSFLLLHNICFSQQVKKAPKILYLSDSCKNDAFLLFSSLNVCDTNFKTSKVLVDKVYDTPTLSHKKNKIAYLEPCRGTFSGKIIITDIEGNNKQLIYNCNPNIDSTKRTETYFYLTQPVWSYDDTKLLFIKSKFEANLDLRDLVKPVICILDLKTKTIDSIKTDEHIYEMYWANDAKYILYTKASYAKNYITGYFNSRGLYGKLFSLNLITKEEKAFTDSTMNIMHIEISPKGDNILLSQDQLFSMDLDGANKKQFTHFNYTDTLNDKRITYIKWSPDGKKIAFMYGYYKTNAKVFVMNADGTGLKELSIPKPQRMFGPMMFTWKGDSKSLLVRYTWTCVENQLYSVSIDGKPTKQVNNNVNFCENLIIWAE
ncbi:MAG TPA: hypothetical protein VK835_01810 [Bacteroidia bacterium]|jgi:Tol biopolymer transport system component|nr:hypothetical protein [Bacteroidia bacterium]